MENVTIIVAMDRNNVIGKNGDIPWNCPADMAWFKSFTRNKAVVMGRKTYESIGRPLPNRTNVVVTRNPYAKFPTEVERVSEVEKALYVAKSYCDHVVVIGGAEIYREAMEYVDEMYITMMHGEWEGDAVFPSLGEDTWSIEVLETKRCPDSQIDFSILKLTR